MIKPLTKREKEIFDFLKISSQIHGFAPSLIEIKEHFNLSAVSTVHEHISNLKRKGYITKEVSQARSIRVIDNELSEQEFIEVPISFEIDQESLLKEHLSRRVLLIHSTMLKGEGRYLAILNMNELYTVAGINNGDLLIIKEVDKLPFNTKAVIKTGNNVYIGEIIEHKQLPAFKKYTAHNAVILKFNIKGEIIKLLRDYT